MKIAFFSTALPFPPEKDGQTVIAYHLLKELTKLHSVSLVCFGVAGAPVPPELRFSQVAVLPYPKRKLFMHYLLTRTSKRPWCTARFDDVRFRAAIKAADEDPTIERIVLHSPFLAEYAAGVTRKPVVLIAIDALSAWFDQMARRERQPLKRWHLRQEAIRSGQLERRLYPTFSAVTVVSEADRQHLLTQAPAAKITVIPNGVDAERFRPELGEGPRTLLFTGAMNYPPNIEAVRWFASMVWPKLTAKEPNLRWVIAGRNPSADVLVLARQDPRVVVTGEVPDLQSSFAEATVYIAPIRSGTGMKNKVLEALASGKPIVGTLESINGIAATPGEHLLLANTPEEFTESVLRLIQDPELRVQLSRNARSLAEQYAWPTSANAYRTLIETLDRS